MSRQEPMREESHVFSVAETWECQSRPNLVKPDEQQFVKSETFGQLKLWQWLLGLILLIILSMFIGNLF